MEEEDPSEEDPRALRRRARWAMAIGTVLALTGLLLVATQYVVYVGEWPDQRPFYLSGIGYITLLMGIVSLVAGAFLHIYYDIDVEAASNR